MKKILMFLTIFLFTSGCAISTHYFQDGASAKAAVDPTLVKIYSGDLAQEYEVIGSVAVDATGDGNAAAELLKTKAGKIGANAVIMTRLTKLSSVAARTGLSGVAVFVK
ncbi:MAG: hypothetical protein WCW35_03540 [Bacteroidota bacterium]